MAIYLIQIHKYINPDPEKFYYNPGFLRVIRIAAHRSAEPGIGLVEDGTLVALGSDLGRETLKMEDGNLVALGSDFGRVTL